MTAYKVSKMLRPACAKSRNLMRQDNRIKSSSRARPDRGCDDASRALSKDTRIPLHTAKTDTKRTITHGQETPRIIPHQDGYHN